MEKKWKFNKGPFDGELSCIYFDEKHFYDEIIKIRGVYLVLINKMKIV